MLLCSDGVLHSEHVLILDFCFDFLDHKILEYKKMDFLASENLDFLVSKISTRRPGGGERTDGRMADSC